MVCQTEEDLVKVKKSYGLTMFLDDMTEMAGVVTKPNEESMEYAQASGSLLCRCMTEPRSPTISNACLRRSVRCVLIFST